MFVYYFKAFTGIKFTKGKAITQKRKKCYDNIDGTVYKEHLKFF